MPKAAKLAPDIYKPRARKGSPFTDDDAEIIAPRLKELGKKYPEQPLTESVVEDARSKNSVLHKYFEWDKNKAFEKGLIDRARELIGAIVYEVVEVNDDGSYAKPTDNHGFVRAFPNIPNDDQDQRNYVPIEIVLVDEDKRSQLIENARREAEAWLQRYAIVSELAGAAKFIRKAIVMMKGRSRKV